MTGAAPAEAGRLPADRRVVGVPDAAFHAAGLSSKTANHAVTLRLVTSLVPARVAKRPTRSAVAPVQVVALITVAASTPGMRALILGPIGRHARAPILEVLEQLPLVRPSGVPPVR